MSRGRMRVALVDDDPNASNALSVLLEDAGFDPVVMTESPQTIEKAKDWITAGSGAAVCDHRLSPRGFAGFTGAQLVAGLYAMEFPAVLISQYLRIDQDVSIRKYRDKIPVLLARTELNPEQLVKGIEVCREELSGRRLPERKAWRTLVRIDAKDSEGGEDVLDAVIPSWRAGEAVRFPQSLLGQYQNLIPEGLRVNIGLRFFAYVNLGAEEAGDLFMTGFEPAIEPQNDGLA